MVCTNFLGRLVSRGDRFGSFLVRMFGFGKARAFMLCRSGGVSYNKLIYPTPAYKISYLEKLIFSNYPREFEGRRTINANLYFKFANGSYAGLRLSQGLPSRRQRTKTNAQTSKRLKIDFSKFN